MTQAEKLIEKAKAENKRLFWCFEDGHFARIGKYGKLIKGIRAIAFHNTCNNNGGTNTRTTTASGYYTF